MGVDVKSYMRNCDTIDYHYYFRRTGKYRVTFLLEVFGIPVKESVEVEVIEHGSPFGIAWRRIEDVLIDELDCRTWDCSCCVVPKGSGGDVLHLDEFIEEIS